MRRTFETNAAKLRSLLDDRRMTTAELARGAAISQRTAYTVTSQNRQTDRMTCFRIADALDVETADFVEGV